MPKKIKITVTIDDVLFNSFKSVLPDYVSVSGVFETLVKEYMAGYYRCEWSVGEMVDVLRGKTTVSYLQGVYDHGLRGKPADEIKELLEIVEEHTYNNPHPKRKDTGETTEGKTKAKKKGK